MGKDRARFNVFEQWMKDAGFAVAWLKQYAEEHPGGAK
jgi:hypothetical protein